MNDDKRWKIDIDAVGALTVVVDGKDISEYVDSLSVVAEGRGNLPEVLLAVRVRAAELTGEGAVGMFNPADVIRTVLQTIDVALLEDKAMERLGDDCDSPMQAMLVTLVEALEQADANQP